MTVCFVAWRVELMHISTLGYSIVSDLRGFEKIIDINRRIDSLTPHEKIDIHMPNWFDANMCAPLGAILSIPHSRGIPITLHIRNNQVQTILQKNKFLPKFGFDAPPILDNHKSTIEYFQFEVSEHKKFKSYVETHFGNNVHDMPTMSEGLIKKFRESLHEVFGNARHHSSTDKIFACGQHFPAQHRLDFSIVDMGVGFHGNINEKMDLDLFPLEAIVWAMEKNRTTKKGGTIPGGLGLKLIKEFIEKNKGKMQIMSYNGFWELSNTKTKMSTFNYHFPGTIVNIEINTADKSYYFLDSEVDSNNIF